MKPKMIWANLAVADLDRTQKFYTELGFKPNGAHISKELVSFFVAGNEFIIHFFLKSVIENNLKMLHFNNPQDTNEIIFTLPLSLKIRQISGPKKSEMPVERLFQNLKVLETIITDSFLPIQMAINSMYFICKNRWLLKFYAVQQFARRSPLFSGR